MPDFLQISERDTRSGVTEIYPKFVLNRSNDLMTRGGDFYAIWIEDKGLWSNDLDDARELIDAALDEYVEKNKDRLSRKPVKVLHLWDTENRMINRWIDFYENQCPQRYKELDSKIIFSDTKLTKRDYATHKLSYPLEPCETPGYERLMSTLYSPKERHKLEWAIGAIITGDSKNIQKFMVLYGAPGTGKSTILNIIQKLFDGYCSEFESKPLGQASNVFAMESLRYNPLVAIQHEGDLSDINDNSRLNSIISHETMSMQEKYKSSYPIKFRTFMFVGTNKPVKITDSKSGLLRRLIDVTPTGDKLSAKDYRDAYKKIDKELSGIAYHCRSVYLADPEYYDDYVPINMLGSTNDFYNFVAENFFTFQHNDFTTLKEAYTLYMDYAKDSGVYKPLTKMAFKEELKNYFYEFKERFTVNGVRDWNVYFHFREDKFEVPEDKPIPKADESLDVKPKTWLEFNSITSIMDNAFADCPAQYAEFLENGSDKPKYTWAKCNTTLKQLDTSKLHYVKPPVQYITVDFDIPDENGNKSYEKNLEEASKWPPTYAELSKSGAGIHLEYIYNGDVTTLAPVYQPHVEIKVFTGGSALRRKLSKCNDLPIAEFKETLPQKQKRSDMFNDKVFKDELQLSAFIIKAIQTAKDENGKEYVVNYHKAHAPNVQFIVGKLKEAYESGMKYDVTNLYGAVVDFAMNSSNQKVQCIQMVKNAHFKSDEASESILTVEYEEKPICFWDVEVLPNLFVMVWKLYGKENKCVKMINPRPEEVKDVIDKYRMVGFNNRRYDNHITYARAKGLTEYSLYKLSKQIITEGTGFFGEAYNLSYTDIYDYAAKKQSLKKWEIELGIHHQELGYSWDEDMPEEKWGLVADYCCNDVLATEAVWDATQGDFTARKILAEIAGMTPNDTTNSLTTRIIFGKNKKPDLVYTDLATGYSNDGTYHENNKFEGYEYVPAYKTEDKKAHNEYRGTNLGFGGYVYAEPGIYGNVALLDVASLHPHSIIAMNCFGEYTSRFKDILDIRMHIKHKEYDIARTMLGGVLAPYLEDESTAKQLAQALKIAINSVYGLTSAGFENPFKDNNNKNNIVALRGALFMRTLQDEVVKRGFKVAHIKTDSIKIPDATPEIIQFCMDFANQYGYTFEHEATYERMCLVNDAVYIAKYADEYVHPGETPWTATGTQFQIPYVFKKLFSGEEIEFDDLCETKSVDTSLYLDFMEGLPDVTEQEEVSDLRLINPEFTSRKFTRRETELMNSYENVSDESLKDMVNAGHDRHFIGKVGLFVPVKDGTGGGILLRASKNGGKFSAATGTKGYKWKEAEVVKELNNEKDIDFSYFEELAADAVKSINNAAMSNCWFGGDYDWLVNGEYSSPNFVMGEFGPMPDYPDEIPWH